MKVERINLDGELGIVNSARVSFGAKKTKLDNEDKRLINFLKREKHKSPFFHPQICFLINNFNIADFDKTDIAGIEWFNRDGGNAFNVRISQYIYDKHIEKFKNYNIVEGNNYNEEWLLSTNKDIYKASRIPYLSFRIKAPFFIAEQLKKHQVGMAQNQISYRYTTFTPEFYIPSEWRKASPSNKQGSLEDEFVEEKRAILQTTLDFAEMRMSFERILYLIEKWYEANIDNGMCGEQARMILPSATFTHFVWTGSLQDYARICSLRLEKGSQKETRDCVQMIYDLCKAEYPKTFDKLIELCKNN